MAVSAVSLKLSQVQRNDGVVTLASPKTFSNIGSTTAAFHLAAGIYRIEVIGSTFGTITLQVLGPDGSTYLTAATAISANGTAQVTLEDGTYRFALA